MSTLIEQAVVAQIASVIRSGCLAEACVVSEKSFQLPDETTITPDIMLRSADGSEVLVVDVKNATPPFGPGDISVDLKTWTDKWQPQLSNYVDAFQNSPELLSQHFDGCGSGTPRVFGTLLLRWPFPVPVELPEGIEAIDWPSLYENLNLESADRSIQMLYDWIRGRSDLPVVSKLEWRQNQVKVADWLYQYSVLSPSTSDAETALDR